MFYNKTVQKNNAVIKRKSYTLECFPCEQKPNTKNNSFIYIFYVCL
uniref:Uncharacterized protein n=1 Tax=Anguilla anguilla TaxID=7936 RepID=A0A0E9XKG9_ANGAN